MAAVEFEVQALRERVARLEGRIEFLYKHLGVTFVPDSGAAEDPRLVEFLKKGDTLRAIGVYREIHKVGIEEARKGVDELRGRLGL